MCQKKCRRTQCDLTVWAVHKILKDPGGNLSRICLWLIKDFFYQCFTGTVEMMLVGSWLKRQHYLLALVNSGLIHHLNGLRRNHDGSKQVCDCIPAHSFAQARRYFNRAWRLWTASMLKTFLGSTPVVPLIQDCLDEKASTTCKWYGNGGIFVFELVHAPHTSRM